MVSWFNSMKIVRFILIITFLGLLLPASFVAAQNKELPELSFKEIVSELESMQDSYRKEGVVKASQIIINGESLRSKKGLAKSLINLEAPISPSFLENDEALMVLAAKIAAKDARISEVRITAQESSISYLVNGKILGVIEVVIPFTVTSDLTERVLKLSLSQPWWNFTAFSGLGDLSIIGKASYDTQEMSSLKTLTFSDYLRMIQAQALKLTEETTQKALSY